MSTASDLLAVKPNTRSAPAAGALSLALLCFGHFFIDVYSSALGALQPRLVASLSLSLTQAGILGGVYIFSNSLCQPLYGLLSDRFGSRLFTVLAPAVAGIFISLTGSASTFGGLLALVVLGGAGIAAFHPPASSRVGQSSPAARGRWMAVFICSGTLGLAFGPTYFSLMPNWLGMQRLWLAGVPGLLCALLLWIFLPPAPSASGNAGAFDLAALKAVWKPLTLLYFCVFIRSIIQVTYGQFLPLYLHLERGFSIDSANYTLSLYLACGAFGGFIGGNLSDRLGGRKVILISMAGCLPFLALFFLTSGALSIAGLLGGGLLLLFTIPVNVVMAQELVPTQTGTVSALMMGFAWGLSGLIFIPLTGWASDLFTMHRVLVLLGFFPLLGFFLAWKLPRIPPRVSHA